MQSHFDSLMVLSEDTNGWKLPLAKFTDRSGNVRDHRLDLLLVMDPFPFFTIIANIVFVFVSVIRLKPIATSVLQKLSLIHQIICK